MFRSHVHMKPFRHYCVCIKVKGAELSPVYYLMQQLLCELSESYMCHCQESFDEGCVMTIRLF